MRFDFGWLVIEVHSYFRLVFHVWSRLEHGSICLGFVSVWW